MKIAKKIKMSKSRIDYRDLKKMDLRTLSAHDRILRTALILFNKNGVNTTGIDKIIAESNVAKMTFYNHFKSKDELVKAYLTESERFYFSNLAKHTTDKTGDPKKQILNIFDYLAEWFGGSDFYGCPFTRGLSDYSAKRDSENFAIIQSHFKKWNEFVNERLEKFLKPVRIKTVLPQLMTLIVGSVTLALAGSGSEIALINKKLAEKIMSGD